VVSRLSMLHSESVLARGGLPLFTELPRRLVPGEWASGIGDSRKPTCRFWPFSETRWAQNAPPASSIAGVPYND
jgi:hypothetical protein